MASSFFDSVHELKTKFPVIEETPVFMFKFILISSFLEIDLPLDFYFSSIFARQRNF